ncbi:hypothetical protein ACWGH8_17435 [Nonomuraea muscovyensis]|jgi:hypothetical protein|uniref:Sensor domain-containing protein n=1 Tax=Nonomuraea muscovyensis TaxID=1124761 RepID=A0A7X0C581_9ACTN|nr:hypothetical protein [Nonomuraea muscovyensis]MBB6348759.1 hypothetical protein [Nonomuraea muscovyensis]MDF2707739.1 hypothetical protein [Nonomuraea muscovyensis]
MVITLLLAVATAVPNGFLLYDKAASVKDDDPETSWTVSRKTNAPLVVNPCERPRLGQSGRASARTIVYTAVPDFSKSEQVILYASPSAARKAVKELRAAVAACRISGYKYGAATVRLGDEALTVTGQSYQGRRPAIGGERAVVARRANALVVYTQAGEWGKPAKGDFARQTRDARRMLGKICDIAAC